MNDNTTLMILQYNVMKSREIVMTPLLHDKEILDYDILAIQEPWRNTFDNSTMHHPLKDRFHLIYPKEDKARVCFFVNKRLNTTSWKITHTSADMCTMITLELKTTHTQEIDDYTEQIPSPQRIHIHNVYNP